MRALILAFAALFLALAAQAQDKPQGIAVEEAWARATPGAIKTGAAYLTLRNTGKEGDRLVGISTPVAESASLHEMKMEGGIMKMRPLDSVALAPGEKIELRPSGNHVMLEGLKHPLKEGEHFVLTLTFEKSGKEEVQVMVGKVGAMGPPGMEMEHTIGHSMGHMSIGH